MRWRSDLAIIDAGHYGTEYMFMEDMRKVFSGTTAGDTGEMCTGLPSVSNNLAGRKGIHAEGSAGIWKERCAVTIGEKVCWYEKGMTYQKIAQEYQPEYDSEIVLVFKDGYYLQELNKTLEEDCELSVCYNAAERADMRLTREVCVCCCSRPFMI